MLTGNPAQNSFPTEASQRSFSGGCRVDAPPIAPPLLAWWEQHGRKNLPWQHERTAYRVWVSEIMLQQTQVSTVIPYYERFMARFATIEELAAASLDDVLHLWTGLGYYARGRNLHKTAQLIVAQHGGEFPRDFDAVLALPGIGRSTAGAVLAFAFGQRHPILDGNVKRVIARYYRIAGWPGEADVARRLWERSDLNTPAERVADYTQAIMDLGASVCVRKKPHCGLCPLEQNCQATGRRNPENYPGKKPKKDLPVRQVTMVLVQNEDGQLLLQRRPSTGIWGGLWSFPECGMPAEVARYCSSKLGLEVNVGSPWSSVRHTFSHFRLDITPVPVRLTAYRDNIADHGNAIWVDPGNPESLGLAAPVKKLLSQASIYLA